MGTPSTPPATKTVRVSPERHEALNRLAERLNGSVDDAVRFLLDREMLRIPLSTEQREAWEKAALSCGLDLSTFVVHRVEAAVQYGADAGTMHLMYQHIREVRNMLRAGVIPSVDSSRQE